MPKNTKKPIFKTASNIAAFTTISCTCVMFLFNVTSYQQTVPKTVEPTVTSWKELEKKLNSSKQSYRDNVKKGTEQWKERRRQNHSLSHGLDSPFRKEETFDQGPLYLAEQDIVNGNMSNDILNFASGKFSKISLTENKTCFLGEEIKIKIVLYNGHGEKMTRGGDFLTLRMENQKVKAAVSGKVMDHNDGTYSGIVKAMWTGDVSIEVMLVGRREAMAVNYYSYTKYRSLWQNFVLFKKGKTTEVSRCAVEPYMDRGEKWCNFTEENAGFPWFCGKPNNTQLSCKSWSLSWSKNEVRFNISSSINALRKLSGKVEPLPAISTRIIGKSTAISSPNLPCFLIAPKVTWNRKSPLGYFYDNRWRSMQCTDTLNHLKSVYKKCLRDRTLYLHGDSTSKQFYNNLETLIFDDHVNTHLHPKSRTDPKYNITISWFPHELPFYHGDHRYKKSVNQAQHILLESLKNDSRDIVILYLYVHLTLNHPDVYREHVKRLVRSVQELVSRAPAVTIAFRGPHVFVSYTLMLSYWGLQYMDILHEEFASLKQNVIYLDYWDMTTSTPPYQVHPPKEMVTSMVRYMMSVVCNRK